jgi:hypothetical protein
VVEGPACTGQRCVRLTRTNALGKLYLRSVAPVTLGAAEFAVFRAFFQAQDAPLNSALQLRFDDERGWLYPGDPHNGMTQLSQTLLRNTPPGYGDKRAAEYRGDGGRSDSLRTGASETTWPAGRGRRRDL